ncbi:TetR/AcrR family transcriptional regulator [Alkalihalobacillus sp. 1P02AB]|uniref:TetR/AcrR family transcriptional regulator n=1 Tax=Alkalihalobacillus sp. 1P02AB TaxID=3132260 RepID=UPI0039A40AE3
MSTKKVDPRVTRTRQLLQEAFTTLIREKDFKAITVRDITEKATVNRATFYAHFTDKYELLDSTITDTFRNTLRQKINCHKAINQETLTKIVMVMCEYQKNLTTLCSSRYQSLEPVIENNIIEELQTLIFHILLETKKQTTLSVDDESLKAISMMLSWSIYGAAYSWNKEGRNLSVEDFGAKITPIIMNGVESIMEK